MFGLGDHASVKRPTSQRTSIRQQDNIRSSSLWKAELKQKCLERARQKRKDAVLKKRCNTSNDNISSTVLELVTREVRDAGVNIIQSSNQQPSTPCRKQNPKSTVFQFSPNCHLPFTASSPIPNDPNENDNVSMIPLVCQDDDDDEEDSAFTPVRPSSGPSYTSVSTSTMNDKLSFNLHDSQQNYQMSEEEVYELMNEIEEELLQEEEYFMEGMKTLQEQEALMEDYISTYYDNNDGNRQSRNSSKHDDKMTMTLMKNDEDCMMDLSENQNLSEKNDDHLVCPICQQAHLIQNSNNIIYCNNHPQTCSFQIQPRTSITFTELSNLFQNIYQEHSYHCHGVITFRMQQNKNSDQYNPTKTLVAECTTCHKCVSVLE